MTENPHENEDLKPESEKPCEEEENEDRKKRSYYYDDAHGYEIYEDEPDEEEGEKGRREEGEIFSR